MPASLTSYLLRDMKKSVYLKLFLLQDKEWTSNCISLHQFVLWEIVSLYFQRSWSKPTLQRHLRSQNRLLEMSLWLQIFSKPLISYVFIHLKFSKWDRDCKHNFCSEIALSTESVPNLKQIVLTPFPLTQVKGYKTTPRAAGSTAVTPVT